MLAYLYRLMIHIYIREKKVFRTTILPYLFQIKGLVMMVNNKVTFNVVFYEELDDSYI